MAGASSNGLGGNGSAPAKKPPRKRLVVCYDGTWNTADNGGNPTNVTRIARAIPPFDKDGVPQVVYYAAGVGTGLFDSVIGGVFERASSRTSRTAIFFSRTTIRAAMENTRRTRSTCSDPRAAPSRRAACADPSVRPKACCCRVHCTSSKRRGVIIGPTRPTATVRALPGCRAVGARGLRQLSRHLGHGRRARHSEHMVSALQQQALRISRHEISFLVKHAFHAIAIDEKRNPVCAVAVGTAEEADLRPDRRAGVVSGPSIPTSEEAIRIRILPISRCAG